MKLSAWRLATLGLAASVAAGQPGRAGARLALPAYHIETVAGSDRVGDGGPALAAQLGLVQGLAADRLGNIYISDTDNHRLRKVTPAGIITTIAGNGYPGFSGDGGPAESAQLNLPYGLAVDAAGNIFLADLGNSRIRKIDPKGIINTVAGNGQKGSNGESGLATMAQLMAPRNVAVDGAGNLYIAEFEGHRVRKVSADGWISTIAGTGVAGFWGDGGPATAAQLAFPAGLALDAAGALYIADSNNQRVRRLLPGGTITSFLGGPGRAALSAPTGITFDPSGNLYVTDQNAWVRKFTSAGMASTVAGTGQPGYDGDGRLATAALLSSPRDVAADAVGNLYIADGQRVRKVLNTGLITTLAGDGYLRFIGDGASATLAQLRTPAGLALDPQGNIYIADTGTHRIRKVTSQGIITTIGGNGSAGFAADGVPAGLTMLNAPAGVSLDSGGNVLIADTNNHRIRQVPASGLIRTVVGSGSAGLAADGSLALSAPLRTPRTVIADAAGNLYLADTANDRVLRVTRSRVVSVMAGNGSPGYAGDGGRAALAQLNAPGGLALDATGNLYVADTFNHCIRVVTTAGQIQTVAGAGVEGFSGDGGTALAARLDHPRDVAVDVEGNLYIADTGNHRIRKVTAEGLIYTIAGQQSAGFSGDGGAAFSAQLNSPSGIAVDGSGNLFVSDTLNHRVRKLVPVAPAPAVAPMQEAEIVNAASLRPGAIAPGEIVSIFATGIGPEEGAKAEFNAQGSLETTLAGVQVLFDGQPAPLFYVQANQINAQAPYTLAGLSSAQLEVQYQGTTRVKMTVAVAEAAPAIFTTAGGTGLAVTINQDGTLGSETPRGSIVTVFATGEGQTNPAGTSGKASEAPFPKPVLPLSLSMGGVPAEILFAGSAPGFAGLLQINARVPAGFIPPGALPLVLAIGSAVSQPGVTIAVR